MVEYFFVLALPLFAFDYPDSLLQMGPPWLQLKVEVAADHSLLCAEGVFHSAEDVLVGLVLDEGEGVDFVAGEGGEFVDLFVDVLGEVVAARAEDVLLVSEDVFEGSAGNVVAELSLLFVFHRIVIV